MRLEADAMRACSRADLAVPDVLVDDDGNVLGTAGLVMSHVDGETLARKILRDDEYAGARAHLVDDLGRVPRGPARDRSGRGAGCGRCRLGHAVLGCLRATSTT